MRLALLVKPFSGGVCLFSCPRCFRNHAREPRRLESRNCVEKLSSSFVCAHSPKHSAIQNTYWSAIMSKFLLAPASAFPYFFESQTGVLSGSAPQIPCSRMLYFESVCADTVASSLYVVRVRRHFLCHQSSDHHLFSRTWCHLLEVQYRLE